MFPARSLQVAVVGRVVTIVIFFAVVFVFLLVGLWAKEKVAR